MSKFEENLKKIDSFQKIIYSQDLASISSLISSITKQTPTVCPATSSRALAECSSCSSGAHQEQQSQEKSVAKTTAKSILDRLDSLKEQKKFKFLMSQSHKCIEDEKCSCDGGAEDEEEEEDEDFDDVSEIGLNYRRM